MNYEKIKLLNPDFDSKLINLILDLEHLRKRKLVWSTHPAIFFQLKSIFHTLESIWSARIEWNRTTLAEFIETKISPETKINEDIKEIQNMEEALKYIDENIDNFTINNKLIRELHFFVTKELNPEKEWSKYPWEYRKSNVTITKSKHIPCDFTQVWNYMEELFNFINRDDDKKYDLIKTALAHHRFVWIHPFDNWNGRTVRLFTYAMLVKLGFNVNVWKIINPTAVFCNDRNKYYDNLSIADNWTNEWLTKWCEYVLEWLKNETEKIDKLLDYGYLSKNILVPTIVHALERKFITDKEFDILKIAIKKQVLESKDLEKIFIWKLPQERSRFIKKLRDNKMIQSEIEWSRKYIINFSNNYLLRSFIEILWKEGFLPNND